jgi:conjugative relaxase-like TrwC/TraI family protein
MTLTLSSGHSAEYLTSAVAVGRESYYLDATTEGEPPGRWYGAGAAAFGLTGEVDHQDMHALYALHLDPRDERWRDQEQWSMAATLGSRPGRYLSADERLAKLLEREPDAEPERVAELRAEAERGARQPVSFIDATFSVQKSVTVLHTAYARAELDARRAGDVEAEQAWRTQRRAVEEAIWQGNRAALDYLADNAGYSRAGHHGGGAGRWVDAHDWTVASFFQHTSRDHDPQLHIHNAILNRVVCADGKVRTLDSRAIHHWRGAAAAVGERTMEEHLTRTLGVRFATRPDGKAREVVGIRQEVMDLFSTRRKAITKKVQKLVADFEAKWGREPSNLEMTRLSQQATMATRRAKQHDGETLDERLARWDRELRQEVADGLAGVARDVHRGAPAAAEAQEWSPSAVIAEALAEVQSGQAAWTRSDLARAVNAALPDSLGGLDGAQVARLLDSLVARALSEVNTVKVSAEVPAEVTDELRRADGASAYAAPSGSRYATSGHIRAEQALRDAAVVRGHRAVPLADVRGWLAAAAERGVTLGADQAAALEGVLTSGAATEVLVGPAGAGKSYALGNLADAWADLVGGRVTGLATGQAATEVLAEMGSDGVTARNIARWLAAQERLAAGRPLLGDELLRLSADDLVVVDEAAMVSTDVLNRIKSFVDAAGAKWLLTGDPRQLAAVGAGGGMSMLTGEAVTYALVDVRRFAAEWEREASLRLREGDESVIGEYDVRGRVVDGGTAESAGRLAAQAWIGDHLAGLDSRVIVTTNEEAAEIGAYIRAQLVALGHVQEEGVALGLQGTTAGVGDLIECRRTDRALGLANRARYRVTEIGPDGSILAESLSGRGPVRLPAGYVAADVALGYVSTTTAAQGLTVDTAHGVVSSRTRWAALYVALTRGRLRSTAYVTTRAEAPDAPSGQTHATDPRTATQVLRDLAASAEEERTALDQAAEEARRVRSAATLIDQYADGVQLISDARVAQVLDGLTATGQITDEERVALAADSAMGPLTRLLRSAELAGHDPAELLAQAVSGRSLAGARSLGQVLHHRITEVVGSAPTPVVPDLAEATPAGLSGEWTRYMSTLGSLMEDRRRELSTQVAQDLPQWAIEAFGEPPADPIQRAEWEHRAGAVELAREATGHTDPAVALGTAPPPGQTEHRAVWHAAWRALGRPEAGREEAELSDGALRVRVRAMQRERTWAPAYVGDELRAAAQAAARHRQDAARLTSEAAVAETPEDAARLRDQAAHRAMLAEALEEQERRLTLAHEARGQWYAETAETRAAAARAEKALVERGVSIAAENDLTTAEEWLAEEARARIEDDAHRHVTEADLAPETVERTAAAGPLVADSAPAAERQVDVEPQSVTAGQESAAATKEPAMPRGVPTMAETAAAVARARHTLDELADRRSAEAARQVDQDQAVRQAREVAWRMADQSAAREQELAAEL